MTYILTLVVAIVIMIIGSNIIKHFANRIILNKVIVTILLLLNIPVIIILNQIIWFNQYLYIEPFLLMFNYIIFILYFMNVNKGKSIKGSLVIKKFEFTVFIIITYSITYILDMLLYTFEIPMTAFDVDAIFLLVLLLMRFYGYIYVYSVADKINEEVPKFISQFKTMYIRSQEMEKKTAIVWLYYVIYTLVMYINKFPKLSTIIILIILGPYVLILIESIKLANGVRKILKAKNFYNYNIFLVINLFIQTILICVLLLGIEYRWSELLKLF